MKKNNQDKDLFKTNFSTAKQLVTSRVKTTNVNILLNRVRQDKKRALKKRIIFSLFLATFMSCLAIYFII